MGIIDSLNSVVNIVVEEFVTKAFNLNQNYPNPFQSSTTIEYEIKDHSKISLKIYDIHGKEVKTLINDYQTSGTKTIIWDGMDNKIQVVPSGIYYCIIQINKQIQNKKILFVK